MAHSVPALSRMVLHRAGRPSIVFGKSAAVDAGLLEDRLVDQLDVEALVPRELVVLAVDELLLPEAREVDVLDGLRDRRVEAEQQALAGVLADPALADREVDDVRRVAGGEGVVQVVLERALVVVPS